MITRTVIDDAFIVQRQMTTAAKHNGIGLDSYQENLGVVADDLQAVASEYAQHNLPLAVAETASTLGMPNGDDQIVEFMNQAALILGTGAFGRGFTLGLVLGRQHNPLGD